MTVETYLRRGQRALQRLLLDPRLRRLSAGVAWGTGGFLLSAGGFGETPLPIVAGAICAGAGWRCAVMSLGAMVGYPAFWGSAGLPGLVLSAAVGLLTVLLGNREECRDQPLMLPVLATFLAGVTELVFWLFLKDSTPAVIRVLRLPVTLLCAMVFLQASRCRDPVTDWLAGGAAVLAVARVKLGRLGLGYIGAGALAVGGAFPASVMAGLGLDLARVTEVPMAAVQCMSFFLRMLPWRKGWQQCLVPGLAFVLVSGICGIREENVLPGLVLGSFLGPLLPARTPIRRRRGNTGAAQVRLELGAQTMDTVRRLLEELEPPPIDEESLLDKARQRSCSGCPGRGSCQQRRHLDISLLRDPNRAQCPRGNRLVPELRRAREQWKLLKADRQRRWEYRTALQQQYGFFSQYLQALADRLPRSGAGGRSVYRIEVGARSREKERCNGDRCIAFPGMEGSYFVLLCDGMGTGLGAAREAFQAATLLRQLLGAGFPSDHALQTLNSLLVLRGKAGAVTVDLAQIHLDTGIAEVYKWGAASGYLLSRSGAQKIGTAAPPPGISMHKICREREKLSLRRGEVLILLSDGVEGEESLRLDDLSCDLPPGELAAKLLDRGCGKEEDDATAVAIRLRPAAVAT